MKKLLALLLVFALCFGLCACGQKSDECENCEDYEDLIEYLEDEKYEKAINWILELAMEEEEDEDDAPISAGEDPALEDEYNQLVNYLEQLEESIREDWTFSIDYLPEGSDQYEWLYGSDALLYLYERLLALGDYRDSQELAARFTVVEDVLLNITESYTDALGNVNEYTGEDYSYNTEGLLVQGPAPAEFEDLFWYTPNYEYDNNDRLVCLRALEYDGTVTAIMNISYNGDGTVASTDYKNADGRTETRTYTYENGQLTQCVIADSYYSDSCYVETYTYNADGQLEKTEYAPQVLEYWDNIDQTVYTYNPDGTVATKRISSLSLRNGELASEYNVYVWSYTYDSQSRVLTALEVDEGDFDAEGNPVESYTEFDRMHTYNYGSYCIYTPAG